MFAVFSATARAEQADDEQNFVDTYRCAVLERLDFIVAQRHSDEQNRFLVLDLPEKPLGFTQDYVQCAFDTDNTRMLCEAASGWWAKEGPRTDFLPKTSVAALAGLGFSTDDSHGNFKRFVDTPDENGRIAAAELLLKALYRAYGARLSNRLTVTAPLSREKDAPLKESKCALIS
jgi:hypothetical protein